MARWLARLGQTTNGSLTKPTKPGIGSFVSDETEQSTKIMTSSDEGTGDINRLITTLGSNTHIDLLADDIMWLKSLLLMVDHQQRAEVIQQYTTLWLNGCAHEMRPHHKQNAGRFAANSWMREHAHRRW